MRGQGQDAAEQEAETERQPAPLPGGPPSWPAGSLDLWISALWLKAARCLRGLAPGCLLPGKPWTPEAAWPRVLVLRETVQQCHVLRGLPAMTGRFCGTPVGSLPHGPCSTYCEADGTDEGSYV